MHTATSLTRSMFRVEEAGKPSTREDFLDFRPYDRLGVVVTEPLGAVGASMLMQLVITAYFDARPERRDAPHYAEIYVFHVGARHGDFSSFDIMPARKEVAVDDDPGQLIEAINDRAITHLAVPHGPSAAHWTFPWKEAEAAMDRIRFALAYSPTGRTPGANASITALHRNALEDTAHTILPRTVLARIPDILEHSAGDEARKRAILQWGEQVLARMPEVADATREQISDARKALLVDGHPCETYRRVSVEEALGMLAVRGVARPPGSRVAPDAVRGHQPA